MTNYIWITCEREGLHRWNDAPVEVSYLKHRHHHIFKFKIAIEVFHNDREVEFHMFKHYIYDNFIKKWPNNLRSASCEMIANRIHEHAMEKHPNRNMIIEVSEDGNNGVIMEYPNQQV